MLTRFPVTVRLWALVIVAMLGMLTTAAMGVFEIRSGIEGDHRTQVKSSVEQAMSIVAELHKRESAGSLTREQAQTEAKTLLKVMRFNGDGYVWINDVNHVMIMHPTKPALDNTSVKDMKDPNGLPLFQRMVTLVKAKGSGYVDYLWPKPNSKDPQPKISYVAGFEPWGWILGSGAYVDDIAAVTNSLTLRLGIVLLSCLLILIIPTILITRTTKRDVELLNTGVFALAEHDSTEHPLPTGRDELAQIGHSVSLARARMIEQETEIELATQDRDQQIRDNFREQREAVDRARAKARTVIDETAGTVPATVARARRPGRVVRRGAGTIEEKVGAADAATRAWWPRRQQADQVVGQLEQSLRRWPGWPADRRGRRPDQDAGPERHHRGGPGRRGRPRLQRGGRRGQGELAMTTARSTEEITATLARLQQDAAEVGAAVTRMGQRIGGLSEATEVLNGVATHQRDLVGSLSTTVHTALERLSAIKIGGDEDERRKYERIPVHETAEMHLANTQPEPVQLEDVGEGGLRCVIGDEFMLARMQPGDIIQIKLGSEAGALELTGLVRHRMPRRKRVAFGIQFEPFPTGETAEALRRYLARFAMSSVD